MYPTFFGKRKRKRDNTLLLLMTLNIYIYIFYTTPLLLQLFYLFFRKKFYRSAAAMATRTSGRSEIITGLTGEDRSFGGNKLFVDLIPRSCWFSNVRTCVAPRDWDRLRKHVYQRVGFKCECCGYDCYYKRGSQRHIEAHERWHYDEEAGVQKLMRLVGLCNLCHEATHMGLAQVRNRGEEAFRHLQEVTSMSRKEANDHVSDAFELWRKRNERVWKLDLTLMTDNGIELKNTRAII